MAKPIRVGEEGARLTGCLYLLGFPGTQCIYIGSTKRGATRLREHGMWLSGHRHPNQPLQEVYDTQPDNLIRHVLLNVYGHTNTQLRNFEWGVSIALHSNYTVLNSDTTSIVKHHLDWEDTKSVLELVDELMNSNCKKL